MKAGTAHPVKCTFHGAREETEMVLFSCVEQVLARTGTLAHQVLLPCCLMFLISVLL